MSSIIDLIIMVQRSSNTFFCDYTKSEGVILSVFIADIRLDLSIAKMRKKLYENTYGIICVGDFGNVDL
jgi:hypothetical protein